MKKISFASDILPMKDILYRLALRITLSREEAEDIVQDTLIRVWNRRDSWDTIENIEAFAPTVCRNMALDRLRLHENQNASLDDTPVDSSPTATANPYERTVQREKVQIVRQLIDALPEKQRACTLADMLERRAEQSVLVRERLIEKCDEIGDFRLNRVLYN